MDRVGGGGGGTQPIVAGRSGPGPSCEKISGRSFWVERFLQNLFFRAFNLCGEELLFLGSTVASFSTSPSFRNRSIARGNPS